LLDRWKYDKNRKSTATTLPNHDASFSTLVVDHFSSAASTFREES
jgi:hypothetical protein